MIDVSQPLELEDGTPAFFKGYHGRSKIIAMIDIPSRPYAQLGHTVRLYNLTTGAHEFGQLPNLRNKEMKMIDTGKSVIYGDKDAKIIHIFENGNLAVVVDGMTDVLTFSSLGRPVACGGRGLCLANKVERKERYINIYPETAANSVGVHSTLDAAKVGRGGWKTSSGMVFTVKQTFEDGVVVKTEVVDI